MGGSRATTEASVAGSSVLQTVIGATGVAAQAPPIVLCKNLNTGLVREIPPVWNCRSNEIRLEFQSYAGALEANDLLQEQIDLLADRVTALEGRMDTAEGDIDNLEGRMDTAEGDIVAVEGRMTTAEGDIDSLEGRMTTAETNITNLDTRVTSIRNFFTGVANNIIGCFNPASNAGATFAITIPEIAIPEIDLAGIVTFPAIVILPQTIIGFPVFNADDVVPCLNGVVTASGL